MTLYRPIVLRPKKSNPLKIRHNRTLKYLQIRILKLQLTHDHLQAVNNDLDQKKSEERRKHSYYLTEVACIH